MAAVILIDSVLAKNVRRGRCAGLTDDARSWGGKICGRSCHVFDFQSDEMRWIKYQIAVAEVLRQSHSTLNQEIYNV